MRKDTILLILIGILLMPTLLLAQEPDKPAIPLDKFYTDRKGHPIRKLFKNFRLGFSTGFGSTYFKHAVPGDAGIYQSSTVGPYIFAGTSLPTNGHSQWISDNVTDTIISPSVLTDFLVTTDTTDISFKSKSFTIPIKLTLHYEFKNFRVGVGFAKDFIFLKSFTPTAYADKIRKVDPGVNTVSTTKYFVMAGYSFARIDKYLFTGDLQFGTNKFSKSINRSIVNPSTCFNLGVTIEREMSEYLKFFIRPNFEFKSYTLSLAESNLSIKHKANALIWNIGFTYSLPELPKCKIKECRIQINHAHGNREVRSRAHPIWKKQNPGYGENDPKLIKYKWRNRKKINAY